MSITLEVQQQNEKYAIVAHMKRDVKIWCWTYDSNDIAQHVVEKLQERWNECPVQKFEDCFEVFVKDPQQVKHTNIKKEDMSENWINTETRRVNIKEMSGK